ncbi:DUF6155 family protein [Robertmurraya massiliosenegalensis]|uniref:DUF6155 family protein n=1 Tax=Robertmurraya TaxID=2837507 RepID=UPI0039A4430F
MTLLKVSELKKELKSIEQKELVQLITELYKLNKEVQHYLSNKFIGEAAIEALYNDTARKVRDEFFPDRGHGKLRLQEAKKAISNFKKLSSDEVNTMDLMLYYVELGTDFTLAYGDIDERFYMSMESMYHNVVKECNKKKEYYDEFKDRLYSIVEKTDGIGWGYHDMIIEHYYSLNWLDDEEE